MKKKATSIIIILIFFAGLSLLLYPTISNLWNSVHATEAVTNYRELADSLSNEEFETMLAKAESYNKSLSEANQDYYLSEDEYQIYEGLLNPDVSGMIGYLEIPSIDVELPVYHGTSEAVLQNSVGHLEWSSLPVGGESTHSVLSGHRGLPSAKLFTDLDRLGVGDTFTITVLNRVITYQVDRIDTVTPDQIESLRIQEGEDLCTLFTCTPYGINTHRLLVRGHRVENAKAALHITSEAVQIEPILVAPFVAAPLMLIAFMLIRLSDRDKYYDETDMDENKIE